MSAYVYRRPYRRPPANRASWLPPIAASGPPTISNLDTSPALPGCAHIRWTTSALATQRVFWDTVSHPSDTDGTQYAFSSPNDTNPDTTNQFRFIPYLTPSTTYFYKVRSANADGVTFSAEGTFTTAANGVRTSNLLIIRVNFPNDLASLADDATINSQMQEVADYVDQYSFGQSAVTWDIVPGTLTAPHDTDFYKALESISNTRRAEQLAIDVSALTLAEDFDTNDYFQYVIWIPQLYDWSNAGFFTGVNGRSQMHLNIFSANYLVQANLYIVGLGADGRANGWVSNDSTVFGSAGAPDPGGLADPFDLLGQEAVTANLNIKHKSGMGWLLPANIPVIQYNGVYRIYAHDTETTRDPDRIYGIRMPGKDGIQYWIEFRQSNPVNSVLINWGGLLLLDMVPTSGGFSNAPLTSGNTFTDPDGRAITFTSTGGTTPGFVDLTIAGLADAPADLAATITSSSSLSADLQVSKQPSLTLAASAQASAAARVERHLHATIAEQTAVTTSVQHTVALSASVACQSLMAVAARVDRWLQATVNSVAGVQSSIRLENPLLATIGSQSSVALDLEVEKPVASMIGATSTAQANTTVEKRLQSTINVQSSVAAATDEGAVVSFATTIGAQSIAAAELQVTKPLASMVGGFSVVQCSVTITKPLQTSVTPQAVLTVNLQAGTFLQCAVSGESAAVADLEISKPAAAVVGAQSAVIASVQVGQGLALDIESQSLVSASLHVSKLLQAAINSESTLATDLRVSTTVEFSSSIAGSTSLTTQVQAAKDLQATSASQTSVTVSLTVVKPLASITASSAALSVSAALEKVLAASIQTESGVVASMEGTQRLQSVIGAQSGLTTSLTVERNIQGGIHGQAQVVSALELSKSLASQAVSVSLVSFGLSKPISLSATVAATSANSAKVLLVDQAIYSAVLTVESKPSAALTVVEKPIATIQVL